MQTSLGTRPDESADRLRAAEILRTCVHCGFCNATCPTYRLTGDELDGPRGRIYLMKAFLETDRQAAVVTKHLDRCLTCRACEVTCPSGVQYAELLDIARHRIGDGGGRPVWARMLRKLFRAALPYPERFRKLVRLGRALRGILPSPWRRILPRGRAAKPVDAAAALQEDAPSAVVLTGCVQSALTPGTVAALKRLLVANGVQPIATRQEACCGGLDLHLGGAARAREFAKRNIDALLPLLSPTSVVISSASGCGVTLKDYGKLLAGDPYAERAREFAARVVDVSEYLSNFEFAASTSYKRVAWHSPCTLQHGQGIADVVEAILSGAGYELVDVDNADECCGSAGTYSYLERTLANKLRDRKLAGLCREQPDVIATANVGCQLHLKSVSSVPIAHWLELLE